jgi:carboxylate-amine ligase
VSDSTIPAGFAFRPSRELTLGVELELQLVDPRDCDLTRAASDLLELVNRRAHPADIKPEVTESMIEVASSIHASHAPMLAELRAVRDALVESADRLNVLVAGGGAHPFQHWRERRIYDMPRFRHVSELYGYLIKQFTVFGQHIHLGCADGDQALYLLHALARYVPHFIALSASSPYYQGVDTAFDSSRLSAVNAFPLSGRAPFLLGWEAFTGYFERMQRMGIVESMKDFYWDIRPQPEYGTIEIRVCDAPLDVEQAAALVAYAQAIARWLLEERPVPSEDVYLPYTFNRFQACRFGLQGELIDAATGLRRGLSDDVRVTLESVRPHARELACEEGLERIAETLRAGSDALWMRKSYARSESLPDLVYRQAERWRGRRLR